MTVLMSTDPSVLTINSDGTSQFSGPTFDLVTPNDTAQIEQITGTRDATAVGFTYPYVTYTSVDELFFPATGTLSVIGKHRAPYASSPMTFSFSIHSTDGNGDLIYPSKFNASIGLDPYGAKMVRFAEYNGADVSFDEYQWVSLRVTWNQSGATFSVNGVEVQYWPQEMVDVSGKVVIYLDSFDVYEAKLSSNFDDYLYDYTDFLNLFNESAAFTGKVYWDAPVPPYAPVLYYSVLYAGEENGQMEVKEARVTETEFDLGESYVGPVLISAVNKYGSSFPVEVMIEPPPPVIT